MLFRYVSYAFFSNSRHIVPVVQHVCARKAASMGGRSIVYMAPYARNPRKKTLRPHSYGCLLVFWKPIGNLGNGGIYIAFWNHRYVSVYGRELIKRSTKKFSQPLGPPKGYVIVVGTLMDGLPGNAKGAGQFAHVAVEQVNAFIACHVRKDARRCVLGTHIFLHRFVFGRLT